MVEPNRFFADRSRRQELIGSPSMYRTTSTMCSSTRGPAMSPPLVTCPVMTTGTPAPLAHSSRERVHSLICVALPGLEDDPSSDSVCMESTTTSGGLRCSSSALISPSSVA